MRIVISTSGPSERRHSSTTGRDGTRKLAPETQSAQVRLATAQRARLVLDAWRLPPSKHLSEGDQPLPVDDPASRSLDELTSAVEASTSDYV
jgi:hypothetical protein